MSNTDELRAAAQQALMALVHHTEQTRPIQRTADAIAALRAALAQQPAAAKVSQAAMVRLSRALGNPPEVEAEAGETVEDALVRMAAERIEQTPAASGEPVAKVRRAHAGGRVRSIGHQVCDLLPGANVQDGAMLYTAPQPAPAPRLKWMEAPRRSEWGAGMMEALVALGPDETLRLYADRDAVPMADAVLAVRPAPARVPLTEALAAAHTANAPLGFTDREKSAWSIGYEEGAANAPVQVAPDERPSRADLIAALTFYAEGQHRIVVAPMTWDTVSGEPPNWEANEAGDMVEDGTIAKRTLAGELTAEDLAADDDGITAKEAP